MSVQVLIAIIFSADFEEFHQGDTEKKAAKKGSSGICGNDNRLKANANSIHLVVTKQ
jgi:hypothetical protein